MNNFSRAFTLALGLALGPALCPGFSAPALAQGTTTPKPFPPPPKQIAPPPPGSFPSRGAAPLDNMDPARPSQPESECMKTFVQLRHKTEERGQALQALTADPAHRPTSEQGCTAYGSLASAMSEMLKFVESNGARCGIPAEVAPQVKDLYEKSEASRQKICELAQHSATPFPKP
ncbi:MAG: hypothetical protein FWD68_08860 [Alphaproteobacteria bacterium]|nr:hypothetical protein [Alphaproteobacteria bacterium]